MAGKMNVVVRRSLAAAALAGEREREGQKDVAGERTIGHRDELGLGTRSEVGNEERDGSG